jgi:hypothetical protein
MKNFLIGAATAAMMMAPAVAEAGGRHDSNNWLAPMITGTLIGALIGIATNNHHVRTEVVDNRHYKPRTRWVKVCGPERYTKRTRLGRYRVGIRNECRMVKKAIW